MEARGVWALLRPPLGRCGPPGGRGDAPSALGGMGGRRPCGPRAGGGEWGAHGPRPGLPFFAGSSPACMLGRPGSWGSPGRGARPAAGGSAWQGGGEPVCRPPRRCGRRVQRRAGSPYLGPSPCLPWPGNRAGAIGVALGMEGVAPIPLRFVFTCCPRLWPVRRPHAPARVRSPVAAPCRSRQPGPWGRVACGLSCVPPPGVAAPLGGGGLSPMPRGGGGGAAPVPCRPERGVEGRWQGGSRRGSPPSFLGEGGLWSPAQPPSVAGAFPPGTLVRPGPFGSPGPRARPGRPTVGQPGGRGGGAVRRPPHSGGWAAVGPPAAPSRLRSRAPPSRRSPQGALERRRRAAGLLWALRE